jgi:hypothetical protein
LAGWYFHAQKITQEGRDDGQQEGHQSKPSHHQQHAISQHLKLIPDLFQLLLDTLLISDLGFMGLLLDMPMIGDSSMWSGACHSITPEH